MDPSMAPVASVTPSGQHDRALTLSWQPPGRPGRSPPRPTMASVLVPPAWSVTAVPFETSSCWMARDETSVTATAPPPLNRITSPAVGPRLGIQFPAVVHAPPRGCSRSSSPPGRADGGGAEDERRQRRAPAASRKRLTEVFTVPPGDSRRADPPQGPAASIVHRPTLAPASRLRGPPRPADGLSFHPHERPLKRPSGVCSLA